jgi:hypothetical protein
MKEARIDRSSVATIALTHAHGDHINGLLMPDVGRAFDGLRKIAIGEDALGEFLAEPVLEEFRQLLAPPLTEETGWPIIDCLPMEAFSQGVSANACLGPRRDLFHSHHKANESSLSDQGPPMQRATINHLSSETALPNRSPIAECRRKSQNIAALPGFATGRAPAVPGACCFYFLLANTGPSAC